MSHRLERVVTVAVLVAATAAALAGCSAADRSSTPTTPAPAPAAQTNAESRALTVGTTEGPYYVTGTAELPGGNLNATNLPGEPIRVEGTVYSGAGTGAPVPGAKVEIWHADSAGAYHPPGNGPASDYRADQLALRGYVLADAQGRYEFTSVYPGYYPGRVRHIHVRASAPGFGGVTTQIIVPPKQGDGTTPETDAIARSLPDSYLVTFADKNGVLTTSFDFHLGPD